MEALRSRAMNRSSAIRQQLTIWGFVLGLLALLIVAFAGQDVLTGENIDWIQALRRSVNERFPWVLISPVVVFLAQRFPIERGKIFAGITVHLLACIGALMLCAWLSPTPRFPPGFRPQPPFAGGPENPERFPPGRGPEEFPPPNRELRSAEPGRPGESFRPGVQRPFFRRLAIRAPANIPIYFVLVSVVHALTYSRRLEERERSASQLEARLTEAKLDALRSQLQPHFLFNTLNAISTLVHKDPAAADEMITNLSELLRAAMDTTEQEIPLRRELDFLNRYLEIQQVRFADRLRVEKEIDALALDGLVPALILQPLVENAIRHGIEPQSSTGLVRIRVRREGNILRLSVRDSGSGAKEQNKEQPGIGLANSRARLQALYGDRAQLMLNSAPEGGFAVELEIPFHEQLESARSPGDTDSATDLHVRS
jgi:two-component sensor histidine kinase